MGEVSLGREGKGWRGTQSLLPTFSATHACLYPRCDLFQWGMLEDPSAILFGHLETLWEGEAECGDADSGGGSVSGGGTVEISG